MPRLKHRAFQLSNAEKQAFLQTHIPGRVLMIKQAVQKMNSSYYHFTVAAVHARSLAQFLGLKLNRNGSLARALEYFPHDGNDSYEVKLSDVTGKPLLDPMHFSRTEIRKLEVGFDTINREVVHLTLWNHTPRHHSLDDPTELYFKNLVMRLGAFCEIILREIEKHAQ
jgi:hypothetical protein